MLVLFIALACSALPVDHFQVKTEHSVHVSGLESPYKVQALDTQDQPVPTCGTALIAGTPVYLENGQGTVDLSAPPQAVTYADKAYPVSPDVPLLPGWLTLLTPLLAIGLAIATRQALLALFAGVVGGAMLLHNGNPLSSLGRTFDTYLPAAVSDSGHTAILLFSLALGGMVGILNLSGSTRNLVNKLATRIKTRRGGMLTTWISGIVIFFDDYANCLLVGSTMRPLTDKQKISREKLSYLIDSTAAPIATLAIVSTWIGFQISEIDGALKGRIDQQGFEIFLQMLPYSFYSIFTIVFVGALVWMQRDFGPMLRAERRAITEGKLIRDGATPLAETESVPNNAAGPPWVAIVSLLSVLFIVVVGIYVSGKQSATGDSFREVIGAADSYAVLLWAGFGGSLVAMGATLISRCMSLQETVDAWISGVKSMVIACCILILAWAIGDMCQDHLRIGDWLAAQISPTETVLPIVTFLLSGAIAFATGSSFSTMSIMIPIMGVLALDASTDPIILHGTLAAILSGAVFGDHCSPISDTTIMSSMASGSDHIDHVRTQAPYALTCAALAAFVGYLPIAMGVPVWISLLLGLVLAVGIVRFIGRPLPSQTSA